MVVRLQRWVLSFIDRHGIWLHAALFVALAYFALAWTMHDRWWGENYRVHAHRTRPVRAPEHWFSPSSFDELEGWKLVGTVTTEGGERVALITQNGERRFLRAGHVLQGADEWTVVNVDNGLVTLRTGLRMQTLALMGDRPPALPGSTKAVRIDIKRRVAGEVFPMLHWQMLPLGGQFVGMKLLTPMARRNAASFGLLEGDIIESVNGLPVTEDVPERLLERFRVDETLTLGVKRSGKLLYLHFSLYD